MRTSFETKLDSPEGAIDGIVQRVNNDGSVWEFKSIDGYIHIVLGRDENGAWMRVGGTTPYQSSWTEELAEKIIRHS